ncbi:MAG: 50S ribosomal protein L32 [Alphaproteobacteria bacterium]|nr:50S ribosomal protein L32 [Alphaproteobacteria bacterium]
MAVPKKKTSKARTAMRRAHDAIAIMPAGNCKKCGEKKRPHHVCAACGNYDGKQVVSK